jgi:hypothetical protein
MNSKINLLIDTIPYSPDIYNDNIPLYESDITNYKNYIPTYQTIFICSLNKDNDLNLYNDPYYMLYGYTTLTNVILPPIKFFSYLVNSNNFILNNSIKIIEYSEKFTPEILELLKEIGFDTKIDNTTGNPEKLFTPTDIGTGNTILYRKLEIYDAITNRNVEIIFIFFYQDYIEDAIINYNNPYIKDTIQMPFKSSVYFEKKIWNVYIYPYTIPLEEMSINTEIYIPVVNEITLIENNINSINFDNKDYINYNNKIDYKWFENKVFTQNENKLSTSMNYSKNTISFGNYFKNKTENDETYFISLNEITKNNDISNYENTFSELNTLKILAKSKSYSNINQQFSMSFDNKMSYINKKYNVNDLKYFTYKHTNSRIETMYPICKNFYINTYINISAINYSKGMNSEFLANPNLYLQTTNWYIRKILLLINPLTIDETTIELSICPLNIPNNSLRTNGIKIEFEDIDLINKKFKNTFNYYIDRFKLIVNFENTYEENEETKTINFVYYIILNIAYYNDNYLIIKNTNITSNIEDLGYINHTYLDYSNTLIPTFFEKNINTKIYRNMVDFNLIDMKYYSFTLNYNLQSSNQTQDNLIYVNHFYYLIPNIQSLITNTNCVEDTEYPISNIFNVLEKKINNFILNLIFINDNFTTLKFNNNNAESILKLSLVFDSNIIYNYENCVSNEGNTCANINYIEYLNYINTKFNNDVLPFIKITTDYNFNQTYNTFMIPTGNYLVLKYRNNFIKTDMTGTTIEMTNEIVLNILSNEDKEYFELISQYNFAVLIKIDDDYNPDDTFFVNNQSFYINDFRLIIKYLTNQGNLQSKIYIVPCKSDYSLYYYQYEDSQDENIEFLLGIELFNFYNGVITNKNIFTGNKIFINMILNEYMNFYELNFIIDVFDIMKQNNTLCFDKNNLIFKKHNDKLIQNNITYDAQRFQTNINIENSLWNNEMIDFLDKNKNVINYTKILNNNLLFIFNMNKIINLLKRCMLYLTQIKNIIFFTDFNLNHPICIPCVSCNSCDSGCTGSESSSGTYSTDSSDSCIPNIPCLNCFYNIKWINYLISKEELINIIRYLATCCININKVNQIINTSFCQEITTVSSLLTKLLYIDENITIQIINDYIIQIEQSMNFYINRIKLVQDNVNELFDTLEQNYTPIIKNLFDEYKKKYAILLKELYVNNIILYAINLDIIKVFDNIIVLPTNNNEVDDYIIYLLIEIITILDINKLNINIFKETLNFVRLFNPENSSIECLYGSLNNNIIKTNYIYNTEYYNSDDGNYLPNINIYTYFPPDIAPDNLSTQVKTDIETLITMIADTYIINYLDEHSCLTTDEYNIFECQDYKIFEETLETLIINTEELYSLIDISTNYTFKKIYIYSYDIIQKFISNCLEIKLYVKTKFYLDNINKMIICNCLLYHFTNANNYIDSINYLYTTIKEILTDPEKVINAYDYISNLLLKQVSILNEPIFIPTHDYLFIPYNQYSYTNLFLKGLNNLKITLLKNIKINLTDNVFKYLYLGYQGEDIIPFNDYNLLIDQRSLLYTVNTENNIYLPTANMHTFNSNKNLIEIIEFFNSRKTKINEYYLMLKQTDNIEKNILQLNALSYGYLHTDYIFINVDNVNF